MVDEFWQRHTLSSVVYNLVRLRRAYFEKKSFEFSKLKVAENSASTVKYTASKRSQELISSKTSLHNSELTNN